MKIFPAIDMLDGAAVRLFQGDYGQKQVFGSDPAAFAKEFEAQGATCLHLVDLNGAKQGAMQHFDTVQQIRRETQLFIELGGGIRSEDAVEQCFAAGVDRVILGTAALHDPAFTKRMAAKYQGKIAVGVDARDGKVAVEGWLNTSKQDSFSFCRMMQDIGVETIIYTDISRDGAGNGANLAVYEQLSAIKGMHFTASGGVSSLQDVAALRDMGLYAAILGKALYTGAVRLEDALAAANRQNAEAVSKE